MSKQNEMAHNYSFRAEELRAIAELDDNVKTREMLMEVARNYERLARSIDGIDGAHKSRVVDGQTSKAT